MQLFARLRATRALATVLVTHVEREAEMLASRIVTIGGCPATVIAERRNDSALIKPAEPPGDR